MACPALLLVALPIAQLVLLSVALLAIPQLILSVAL